MSVNVDRFAQCAWPDLREPFASALRQAIDFAFQEADPVGIIATGTIIRGTAHASSDLDVYVIHRAPHRRRIQKFFGGIPTEIFINPPGAVREYFADEDRDGRRITAHMLATGMVVYRSDSVVDHLVAEAAEWLAKDTPLSDVERVSARYAIASRLEDALDILETDDVTATMLLMESVLALLEYCCKAENGRIPRRKDLVAEVAARHPEIARLAVSSVRAATVSERANLAIELAERVIGVHGFFEWDSGPGPAPT